jgi:hypothetical protein
MEKVKKGELVSKDEALKILDTELLSKCSYVTG